MLRWQHTGGLISLPLNVLLTSNWTYFMPLFYPPHLIHLFIINSTSALAVCYYLIMLYTSAIYLFQVSYWWLSGEPKSTSRVTFSQMTPLDKERQVFQRRHRQDVKLVPNLPHNIGAGASYSLSPAEFTPESEDYSPSSADTVRSPVSPF